MRQIKQEVVELEGVRKSAEENIQKIEADSKMDLKRERKEQEGTNGMSKEIEHIAMQLNFNIKIEKNTKRIEEVFAEKKNRKTD